jgi:ABC-type nitrate/sulfonate/bicarbonate transport system substrate-binding protein
VHLSRWLAGLVIGGLAWIAAGTAFAADKLVVGIAGQASPMTWPYTIAMSKGYLAKRGIEFDIIYTPSASAAIQQLVGGSLDFVASTSINEPIHAAAKGAPVGILRMLGRVPPYAILAQPNIHSLKELKGKTIAVGGLVDISRVYFERMLEPNGLKWGEYDAIVIGSTTGRMAALKSGAVSATMLLPPFNFQAEQQGFNNIGLTVDYAGDLPFTASVLSLPWAAKHLDTTRNILAAFDEGLAWFNVPANRAEAISILVTTLGLKEDDVARSYDFLHKIEFFAPDNKVSRGAIRRIAADMKAIGDYEEELDIDKLAIPGVTQFGD